jgi:hypothetical protein
MEDRQTANVGPEMLRIPRNSHEGLGDRLKEEGIEGTRILEGEPIEDVRQGKDDMEVGHIEELTLSGRQPGRLGRALTLGTVPIPTRIVAALEVAAVVTLGRVASKRRGPAQGDSAEHAVLLGGRAVPVSREIGGPILLDDVGHFERRAGHSSVSNTWATSGCSKGLGVACRVLLATCR